MIHHAAIKTRNGWWFRYTVHRCIGIGIPEKSTSRHRTLRGAERAVRRWKRLEFLSTMVA